MATVSERQTGKWSRRSEERPAEIMTAALALFAERGFATTKLEDVARAAGISKGTVYLYFPTKEDLFRAVVRRELVPALEDLEVAAGQHAGTSDELLRLMFARIGEVMEGEAGCIPKLVIAEARGFPEIARFYADEVVGRGIRILDGILKRGAEAGEFRALEGEYVLPVLMGPPLLMLLWAHSLGPHADFDFDHRAVLATHIDILLRGIAADQPKSRR